MSRRYVLVCLVGASLTAMTIGGTGAAAGKRPSAHPVPAGADHRLDGHRFAAPPNVGQCEAIYRLACYSPDQLRRAYDVLPLHEAGRDGTGQTIAIVDSFGSPTIEHDLRVF